MKKLEARRITKRWRRFDTQDVLDSRRRALIEGVEEALQSEAQRVDPIRLRWSLR